MRGVLIGKQFMHKPMITPPSIEPPVLLFGATSILGFNIATMFHKTVLPFVTRANRTAAVRQWPLLGLEDPNWSTAIFKRHTPDILLYCHAVCDVPKCEAAPGWARAINVEHVGRVLDALPQHTRLVYVSSDHVFGGDGVYDEKSSPCPISVYGRTRLEAEELILHRAKSLVIRVGLPIGPSPNGRTGHRDWIRYRFRRNLPVTIGHDEYRSVVWASDLAVRVMQLAHSNQTGLRHIAATRVTSRVEPADYLLSMLGTPATYRSESRHQRSAPHLGLVELATVYRDILSRPLPSIIDDMCLFALDRALIIK
jgi:dTDP-4-dehydrorhamnose reductase